MWNTVENNRWLLSHDPPCVRCGHAWHTYLPCSDDCDCDPDVGPVRAAIRPAA